MLFWSRPADLQSGSSEIFMTPKTDGIDVNCLVVSCKTAAVTSSATNTWRRPGGGNMLTSVSGVVNTVLCSHAPRLSRDC